MRFLVALPFITISYAVNPVLALNPFFFGILYYVEHFVIKPNEDSMPFQRSFSDLIFKRYSCRHYDPGQTSAEAFTRLDNYIHTLPPGPFNVPGRFRLVLAGGVDRHGLRGLGTYGAIKDSPGFIIGVTSSSNKDLEDFGYRMELVVLKATDLDMGTCWLGGSFTRSTFSKKADLTKDESLPAVCSVGFPAAMKTTDEIERARKRLGWETLFFMNDFASTLSSEEAGVFADPLELVRLAPSARNCQPWRILKAGDVWHFYLQRTKPYHEFVVPLITGIADLQRVDMGIAMSHFEMSARSTGLSGAWVVNDPGISLANALMEYCVSWVPG